MLLHARNNFSNRTIVTDLARVWPKLQGNKVIGKNTGPNEDTKVESASVELHRKLVIQLHRNEEKYEQSPSSS
jgi:hypothetical protein